MAKKWNKDKTKINNSWYKHEATEMAKKIAKLRDGYVCQKCKADYRTKQIHGSHVYSTGAANWMRADILNIKALCYSCHMNWWHKNVMESSAWFKEKFPERACYLDEQFKNSKKKINWEEIYSEIKIAYGKVKKYEDNFKR